MRFAAAIAGLMLAGCAVAQPAARPADWQAAIVHVENERTGIVCSGVLVQADLVATAGHCQQGATARQLLFKPAGIGRTWRGAEILAAGGFTDGAEIEVTEVGRDWLLVRTATPMPIAPIPVAAISHLEIQKAIAGGAHLASFGFADGDVLLQQHGCALQPVFGDSFFTTRCSARPGDSGGPVLLIDASGVRLIGLTSATRSGEALVVSARRFAPWAGDDDPFDTRALASLPRAGGFDRPTNPNAAGAEQEE